MVQVSIYRNLRNEGKFLEVRRYSDGHNTIVQFNKTMTGGRSYNGFKKPYRLRVKKSSLEYLIASEYEEVEV